MQAELHKKYHLRSRKISRSQENEGEQQVLAFSRKATPQESQPEKQVNKGKQQLNANGKTQIFQGGLLKTKVEKFLWRNLFPFPK